MSVKSTSDLVKGWSKRLKNGENKIQSLVRIGNLKMSSLQQRYLLHA